MRRKVYRNRSKNNHLRIVRKTIEKIRSSRLQSICRKLYSAYKDGIYRDKEIRDRIIRNELQYRIFYDNSNDAILFTQANGQILAANPAACRLFGRTEGEIIALGRNGIVDLNDPQLPKLLAERNLKGKARGELTFLRNDGTPFPAEVSSAIYTDVDGREKANIIIRDITEQKRAQDELNESRELLKFALEGTNDGVWDVDFKTGKFYISPRGHEILGYNPDEIITHHSSWANLIHPDDLKTTYIELEKHLQGNSSLFQAEQRLKTKTSEWKWILTRGKVVSRDANGKPQRITGTHTDINEKKLIEQSLLESEEKYRILFETSIDAIIIAEDNVITFLNNAALKLLGAYNQAQITGKTIFQITYPGCHQLIRDRLQLLQSQQSLPVVEEKIIRTDGQTVDVEVSTTSFKYKGHQAIMRILRDITQRKKAENDLKASMEILTIQNEEHRILNEALKEATLKAQESDRLKSVFLQNMSHEIRTPMNAIMGFSELLNQNFNNKVKLENFANIIHQRSADLLYLINEILDLSKIEAGQQVINIDDCNLKELFEELYHFFVNHRKKIGKKSIDLISTGVCDTRQIIIRTDKVKLKQIFINLIYNAFKFTDKGKIIFGCRISEGEKMEFFVSDSGKGIPADKQQIIFNRFVQVDAEQDGPLGGTGLGLSIVKGLVELLQGNISVTSEVNAGSTFYFTISYQVPEYVKKLPSQPVIHTTEKLPPLKVLIVEDDEYNAEYLKEVLADTGLQILAVSTGEKAVETVKSDDISIILLDIRMNGMDGFQTASLIKQDKPQIRIIAQTAFASEQDANRILTSGFDDYISKPIKSNELIEKVIQNLKFKLDRTNV